MGAFLEKPKTQKTSEESVSNGLPFGVSCMQGWRIEMEDSHRVVFPLPDALKDWSYYSVFDGHAGSNVAQQAANRLINVILETNEFKDLRKDQKLHTNQELITKGIENGFLAFDAELEKNAEERSGSTAVVAFITPAFVVIGNCGDSRAIVVSDERVALATEDHKPTTERESNRIEKAGGSVILQRINGALAVSRSLGDFDYKKNEAMGPTEQLVSAKPDVYFHQRNARQDQFLFIACDGIWDVFLNDDVTQFILHRMRRVPSYAKIVEEVLDNCLYNNSRDNMSALLVGLDARPKVDPVLQAKDEELNKRILKEVQSLRTQGHEYLVPGSLCDAVEKLELENYPPGGLRTKRYLIEELVMRENNCEDEQVSTIVATQSSYALSAGLANDVKNNHHAGGELIKQDDA